MSLQIVQNQQLKPIGDKVPIDTTLSSSSENAISNKAVNDEITRINSDLSDKQNISSALKFEIKIFPAGNIAANGDLIISVPDSITNTGQDIAYIVNTALDFVVGTARRENDTAVRVTFHNFYSQPQNITLASVTRLYL